MIDPRLEKRNRYIVNWIRSNSFSSYARIGRYFGLTRERIRQIYKEQCKREGWQQIKETQDILRKLKIPPKGYEILSPWCKPLRPPDGGDKQFLDKKDSPS